MNARRTVTPLAMSLLLSVPIGAAAQSVLMQAKTSGGAEVATIRTDSMRLLVPLDLLAGLKTGYMAVGDSLRVGGEASFLATGTYQAGTSVLPPASGAGTRMMWYPEKAAFRAGNVNGTQWDASSVGDYSTAFGVSSTASGNYSFAAGDNTVAGGSWSTAVGAADVATGQASFAAGYATWAKAFASFIIGRYAVADGTPDSWVSTEPLFVAGNGSDAYNTSNALTLYKNGNLTIAGTLTQSSDARLKEDMEPLEGTLAKVMQLTPIRYRFRPGTGRPGGEQIGLTAQQVRPLFPELVKQDADGYLSLSYANLSAVLVKAVQEQQAKIRTLQQRNDQLESEVARLQASQSEILRRLRAVEAGGSR